MHFISENISTLWSMSALLSNVLIVMFLIAIGVFIYAIRNRIVLKKKSSVLLLSLSLTFMVLSIGAFYFIFFTPFQLNDIGSDEMYYKVSFVDNTMESNKIELTQTEINQIHSMLMDNKFLLTWQKRFSYYTTETNIELSIRNENYNGDMLYMIMDDDGSVIVYHPSMDNRIIALENNKDLYEYIYKILSDRV